MSYQKTLFAFGVAVMAAPLMASVRPARLALDKVQPILLAAAQQEIESSVVVHKAMSYPVGQTVNFQRGKFSEEQFGFAEFRGSVEALYVTAGAHFVDEAHCDLYARVRVVPFAKQEVPILEEETNVAQLILD